MYLGERELNAPFLFLFLQLKPHQLMETINKEEFENNLEWFTGSTQLYEHIISDYKMLITEGVKYLAEEGHAYWLLDLILSYQWTPKFFKEEFQVWTLTKQRDESWLIECTDGNNGYITHQHIPFSDFPLETIRLWVVNQTIMLPSEY
jgi:hypothetical protein